MNFNRYPKANHNTVAIQFDSNGPCVAVVTDCEVTDTGLLRVKSLLRRYGLVVGQYNEKGWWEENHHNVYYRELVPMPTIFNMFKIGEITELDDLPEWATTTKQYAEQIRKEQQEESKRKREELRMKEQMEQEARWERDRLACENIARIKRERRWRFVPAMFRPRILLPPRGAFQ